MNVPPEEKLALASKLELISQASPLADEESE